MKKQTEPQEIMVYECKVEKARFFDESALDEHMKKHSTSFQVKRVEDIPKPVVTAPVITEPQKRKYTRRKKTEAPAPVMADNAKTETSLTGD